MSKISNIFINIQRRININKFKKKENEMNFYAKIHDMTTYGNSYNQMAAARDVIANYAKYNGVTVDIYDARKMVDATELDSPKSTNSLSDKLILKVTNLLTGKSKEQIISANTDMVYTNKIKTPIILEDKTTKTINVLDQQGEFVYEEPFLRYLYRNVEKLTNLVTHNKNHNN